MVCQEGYVKVRLGRTHPLADPNGYVYEHQLIAVAALGRQLASGEVVHHLNGDRGDNRWENLEVVTRAQHNAHHNGERGRDALGRFLPAGRVLDGRTWDEMPS